MNRPSFNSDGLTTPGGEPRPRTNSQLSQTQINNAPRPSNFEGRNQHIKEALSYFSPNLLNKSSEELFSLVTDEKDFIELFNSLPEIINQNVTLKDFQTGNEDLASDNIAYKDKLERLKVNIEEKVKDIKELEFQFQSLKENESRLFEKFHPKTILSQLREKQTIVDSESCELTAQFLRKELSIEDYIKKYRESRTRYHQYELRIAGIEKRALPVLDSAGISIKFMGN